MLKSDIKPGMIVEFNNGDKYFVLDDGEMMTRIDMGGGFMSLGENYSESLKNVSKHHLPESRLDWSVKSIFVFDKNTKKWVKNVPSVTEEMTIRHEIPIKITFEGNKTTVLLEGISESANCLPEDTYSKAKGISIAYTKAMIKALQKELKRLKNNDGSSSEK